MTLDEQINDLKNKVRISRDLSKHLQLQRTLTTFEIDRLTVEIEQINNKIWMLQEELKEQQQTET